jgi:hypothetical protein
VDINIVTTMKIERILLINLILCPHFAYKPYIYFNTS